MKAYAALADDPSCVGSIVAELDKFTVRGDDTVHLVPWKRLVASRSARIEIRRATLEADEAFATALPDRSLLITDFSLLRRPAPYCCTSLGVIRSAGEQYESATGIPMQEFELVCRCGLVVKCMACGGHVGN